MLLALVVPTAVAIHCLFEKCCGLVVGAPQAHSQRHLQVKHTRPYSPTSPRKEAIAIICLSWLSWKTGTPAPHRGTGALRAHWCGADRPCVTGSCEQSAGQPHKKYQTALRWPGESSRIKERNDSSMRPYYPVLQGACASWRPCRNSKTPITSDTRLTAGEIWLVSGTTMAPQG